MYFNFNEQRFNIILGTINILVTLLLFTDTFISGAHYEKTTIDNLYKKHISGKISKNSSGNGSYELYYVNTSDGREYEVPEHVYNSLAPFDTISILSSRFFDRPLRLEYSNENDLFSCKIGKLNSNRNLFWSSIIFAVISGIAIFFSLKNISINNSYFHTYLHILAGALSLFNILFYFSL